MYLLPAISLIRLKTVSRRKYSAVMSNCAVQLRDCTDVIRVSEKSGADKF